ncbi:AAA family ATPase [Phyllobacterium ifriqiyense]|uniref:AAA family ATPase n=1 Tax=Phyllobacterium ifriqiyense TaxID=314238 RepID=UPI003390AF00
MHILNERFVVLTGGPGSGKTTLIEELKQRGHAASVEAGRAIIQQQTSIEGPALPWKDPALFSELMLCWELRSYEIAQEVDGMIFFDRGIPDIAGYLQLSQLAVPAHVQNAAEQYRYNPLAFILSPWEEIFEQDRERKQTFAEAVRTYHAMVKAYGHLGYDLIEVPRLPASHRADFILEHLS